MDRPRDIKRVTVKLPAELLQRVQQATGKGITATLIIALEELDRRDLASSRSKIAYDLYFK